MVFIEKKKDKIEKNSIGMKIYGRILFNFFNGKFETYTKQKSVKNSHIPLTHLHYLSTPGQSCFIYFSNHFFPYYFQADSRYLSIFQCMYLLWYSLTKHKAHYTKTSNNISISWKIQMMLKFSINVISFLKFIWIGIQIRYIFMVVQYVS